MLKGKLILILLLSVFVFHVVDARLGEFDRGECVNIIVPSNSTAVNLSSLEFPNSSTALTNQIMTQDGKIYNYTYCSTDTRGVYTYSFVDAEGNVYGNDFVIGKEVDTGQSILLFIILGFSFILFLVFLWPAIKLPGKNWLDVTDIYCVKVEPLKYLKVFCIWASFFCFIWFLSVLNSAVNTFLLYDNAVNLINSLFLLLYMVGGVLTVAVVWWAVLNVWRDIIFNKEIVKFGKAVIR